MRCGAGRKALVAAVLAGAVAVPAVPAVAQPPSVYREDEGPPARPMLFGANLGMGSAVGNVGLTLGYLWTRDLELEFGIGRGYSGAQFSVMPKALLGSTPLRLVLGLGPSLSTNTDGQQVWINGEAGVGLVGRRLFATLTGGLTYLLAGRVPSPCFLCDTTPTDRRYYDAPATFPTTRFTLGIRF
jgi:hypothetical protein